MKIHYNTSTGLTTRFTQAKVDFQFQIGFYKINNKCDINILYQILNLDNIYAKAKECNDPIDNL